MAAPMGEWRWLLAFVPYIQPEANVEAAGAIQGPGPELMCEIIPTSLSSMYVFP